MGLETPQQSVKKRIGLKEIAAQAGVAIPTVSLVLTGNQKTYISERTRQRVLEIAKALKYRPKFSHKLINGKATGTVAIVLTEKIHRQDETIRDLILRLIEKLETQQGLSSYLAQLEGEPENKLFELIDRGADHFVVIGAHPQTALIEKTFLENGIHFVGYNSQLSKNVTSDTPLGFAEIFKHFLSHKRESFKFVVEMARESYLPNSRMAGLKRALPGYSDHELKKKIVHPIPDSLTVEDRFKAGYQATKEILIENPRIQAIAYHTDHHVLGGIRYLTEKKIEIGNEVWLAGYNAIEAIRFHSARISTAGPDIDAILEALSKGLADSDSGDVSVAPKIYLK